jgi:enoyl-CoA hydratase/carnithine racemase
VAAVVVERLGNVALVQLNRPERLNAVDESVRRELPQALRALDEDAEVQAVVLAGRGERAFSAGQDIEEAARFAIDDVEGWFTRQHAMFAAVRGLNKPSVAALVGVAAGAGYQLALYCDLRVGHPGLKIGQPEVKTGLGSILGSSQMMWHVPLSVNAELSLTGDLISGERAHQLGLLNYLVDKEQVLEKAIDVARLLATRPAHAIRLTKERLRELTQAAFEDILAAAKSYQKRAYQSGEPQRIMKEWKKR